MVATAPKETFTLVQVGNGVVKSEPDATSAPELGSNHRMLRLRQVPQQLRALLATLLIATA